MMTWVKKRIGRYSEGAIGWWHSADAEAGHVQATDWVLGHA